MFVIEMMFSGEIYDNALYYTRWYLEKKNSRMPSEILKFLL